jgi:hypothetical protein
VGSSERCTITKAACSSFKEANRDRSFSRSASSRNSSASSQKTQALLAKRSDSLRAALVGRVEDRPWSRVCVGG